MSDLKNKIMKQQKELNALLNAQAKQYRNLSICCAKCGIGNKVEDLVIREHQHYVAPYSCTGGDYWTLGDNPDRSFVCKNCGVTNRMIGSSNNSIYWLFKQYVKHELAYNLEDEKWINNHD